jgi:hypothetical protein
MNGAIRGSSAVARNKCSIEEDRTMLARRFSLICLLTALFGMGMASLVAEHHENPRGQFAACPFDYNASCR